jgi:hypothetical protein
MSAQDILGEGVKSVLAVTSAWGWARLFAGIGDTIHQLAINVEMLAPSLLDARATGQEHAASG